MEYLIATRPWSFTAGLVPVLVTAAVTETSFRSFEFARALSIAISVQAGANLTNTYFDFINGVDNERNGEKTLVQKKCNPTTLMVLSIALYTVATASIWPHIVDSNSYALRNIFISGIMLAFFYTANPVGLKYRAFGDITIFLCFGPLLMQCCSILFTGATSQILYIYSIPIGLYTEAILHSNNARDIESDKRAKIVTLASLLGPKLSEYFFMFLLFSCYASILVIVFLSNWGCIATFLTVPISLQLIRQYRTGDLESIDEMTAKAHAPFGFLMFLGIFFTKSGILNEFSGISNMVGNP